MDPTGPAQEQRDSQSEIGRHRSAYPRSSKYNSLHEHDMPGDEPAKGSKIFAEQMQGRSIADTASSAQYPASIKSEAGPASGAGEGGTGNLTTAGRLVEARYSVHKGSRQSAFEAAKRTVSLYPYEISARKRQIELIGRRFKDDVFHVLQQLTAVGLVEAPQEGEKNFVKRVKQSIEKAGLECLSRGAGYAGGIKATHGGLGLFFKFALDNNGLYGSNRMAAKVAKREAAASRWVHAMDSVHVSTPLLVCMDVSLNAGKGKTVVVRVQAFAEVKVESSTIKESGTLRVGSSDAGKTYHRDQEQIEHVVKRLAEHFYIRPNDKHVVKNVVEHTYSTGASLPDREAAADPCTSAATDHSATVELHDDRDAQDESSSNSSDASLHTRGGSQCPPCSLIDVLRAAGVASEDVSKLERVLQSSPHGATGGTHTSEQDELAATVREAIASSSARLKYQDPPQPVRHVYKVPPEPVRVVGKYPVPPQSERHDASDHCARSCTIHLPFDVEIHQLPSGQRMVLDTHRLLIPDVPWIQWMASDEALPCVWGIYDGRIVTGRLTRDVRDDMAPFGIASTDLARELQVWVSQLDRNRDEPEDYAPDTAATGIRFSSEDMEDCADTGCIVAVGSREGKPAEMIAIISCPAWYYRRASPLTCLLPPESARELRKIEVEDPPTSSKQEGSEPGLCPDLIMEYLHNQAKPESRDGLKPAARSILKLYRRAHGCGWERYRSHLAEALDGTKGKGESSDGVSGSEVAAAGRSSRPDAVSVESKPAKLRAVLKRTMHSLGLGLRHVRLLVEQLVGPDHSVLKDRIRKALAYGCKPGSMASRSLEDLCACVRSKGASLDAHLVDFATTAAACFASKGIVFDTPLHPLSTAEKIIAPSSARAAAGGQTPSGVIMAAPCFGADFASSHGIHQQETASGVAALIHELAHVQRVGGNGEVELLKALCDLAAKSSGLKAVQIAAAMRCTVGQVDPLMQLARITTGLKPDGTAMDDAAIDRAMAHVVRVLQCLKRYARFDEALVVSGTICDVILASSGKRCSRYARYASILQLHAEILREAEKGSEALRCFRICEDVYGEVFGSYSRGALNAMRCQAEVLQDLGKLDDALQKYKDCADRCWQTEWESSLEYAAVLGGWASCLDDKNIFADTRVKYEKCMGIRKRLLGEAHPKYADTLNDLAVHLQVRANKLREQKIGGSQRMYQEAIETLEKCCQITETCFGKDHPDYAASLANLANCLRVNGKHGRAYERYSEAVKLSERASGKRSWLTGKLMSSKAACQYIAALGKPEVALELFRQADAIFEESGRISENPIQYADHLDNMAECLQATGKYPEAVQKYRKCLEYRKEILGKKHPDYESGLHNLNMCLEKQENIKALEQYERSLSEPPEAQSGIRKADRAITLYNMGCCLTILGRHKDAARRFEECEEKFRAFPDVLGRLHPDYANTLNMLWSTYERLGNTGAAVAVARKLLGVSQEASRIADDTRDSPRFDPVKVEKALDALIQRHGRAEADAMRKKLEGVPQPPIEADGAVSPATQEPLALGGQSLAATGGASQAGPS